MDHASHFEREVRAFQAAARQAADTGGAPLVPSCPGWSVADLVLHLGGVHRAVTSVIRDRLDKSPDPSDLSFAALPPDLTGWPAPEQAPNLGPIPAGLLDWFADGAAGLGAQFRANDPGTHAWTWSAEQTVGFWLRMQTIEAAVHRWDAESAVGTARPIHEEIAADAIGQTFEVMAPARRAWRQAPGGAGERFRFRRTDGAGCWTVHFDGDDVRLTVGDKLLAVGDDERITGGEDVRSGVGGLDVEVAGTASDLMLFLWQRIPADGLDVRGDREALDRYFVLVPPV
ncbi:maleylpyruvate isomerase family mycothiol-dependent enzyme [Nonomuraea jiangxiensis]|nr:maleylpyruvate isomerase family mycothiol-dependent enzyme [Nonomuraea jiangxiensis]